MDDNSFREKLCSTKNGCFLTALPSFIYYFFNRYPPFEIMGDNSFREKLCLTKNGRFLNSSPLLFTLFFNRSALWRLFNKSLKSLLYPSIKELSQIILLYKFSICSVMNELVDSFMEVFFDKFYRYSR